MPAARTCLTLALLASLSGAAFAAGPGEDLIHRDGRTDVVYRGEHGRPEAALRCAVAERPVQARAAAAQQLGQFRNSAAYAISAAPGSGGVNVPVWFHVVYKTDRKGNTTGNVSDAMVLLPPLLAVYILGIWRPSDAFGAIHVGLSFGVLYGLGPATATVRTAAQAVTVRPFMDAARVAGGGDTWLVTRHVLPHLYAHAAVQAMIGATGAVIADAFLAYRSAIGENVGFGMMVYDGIVWSDLMAGIAPVPWWIMLAGAGGITLLAAAFYLIGVGLREALDPRARSVLR